MPTILEIIESRLIPDEQAKKARGEVFTPLNLVRELLFGIRKSDFDNGDILPWGVNKEGDIAEDDEDDRIGGIPLELWRDPDTKWLDPANGIGNFPFIAFQMLDYQLKHHGTKGSNEWSDERRKRHIIGNMLYMIEIDRGNVNTSVKIFRQLVPGLTANVYCGDALKVDTKKEFNVETFDVVMGNPPFNTSRFSKGQTGTLWDIFIKKFLDILNPDGFFAFITPQLWRKPEHELYKQMTNAKQLYYLRILGERETTDEFHVGSRVDIYLIENKHNYTESTIIDETGKLIVMDVSALPFLPNYMIEEIINLLVPKEDGISVIHSRSMYGHDKKSVSKIQDTKFTLPVVNTMTQKGNTFIYADSDKGHFGEPKVILSVNRNQYPYNDYKGEYGLSDSVFGIPIKSKEEGDAMVDAINTSAFKEIIKATKWGAYQTEHRMFNYFRPDFYKQFLKKSEEGGTRHVTPRKKKSSRVTRRNS